jgi:lysozyme
MLKLNKGAAIIAVFFILITGIFSVLLAERKIWFVYPDKKIYSVEGLDISNHQGAVNWDILDKKYQFIFIKATEGDTFVDKRFYENAAGVKRTGKILGAYHFFHFNYGGAEQADNFIDTVGKIIDLPPVVDFEYSGNPGTYDQELLITELRACINRLEEYYGHRVIIYTTRDAFRHTIKNNFDNPLWYRSILFPIKDNAEYVFFWQYHNSAIIKGIDTKVDLNVFKGNREALEKLIMGGSKNPGRVFRAASEKIANSLQ